MTRTKNMEKLNQEDLQPGDVLLYHSQTIISKLIRKLDGTPDWG